MKKSTWIVAIIVIVIIVVAIIANRAPSGSTTTLTSGPLQVSAILPLTGPAAFFGEESKNGMELANASNKIGIAYEDSASTGAGGASAMSKVLIGSNKDMVIVALSAIAGSVSPIAINAKIPVLQTLVSASDIASKSPYTFRYFTSGGQEGPIAADITLKNLGSKRPAMIYSNDEYGMSYYNGFKSRIESASSSLVASATFINSDTDYRSQLTKIMSAKPDAIYIIALDKSLVAIIKQAREMGVKAPLITNWVMSNPSVIGLAGQLTDGVYFTTPSFNLPNPDPMATQFKSDYQAKYGKAPSAYAAITYDIVNILAMVNKSSSDTGLDVVNKIKAIGSLKGVMGNLTIDANKEITFALYPAKVENGKIVTFDLK